MTNLTGENLFNSFSENQNSQVKLWQAVMAQAIADLQLPKTNKRYRTWQKQAKNWFDLKNQDFILVCKMARLDANQVLKFSQTIK